tara:strand:- start:6463 stop:6990 length:528 start_codon:yes stop_codon:yes gene_type:complete
MPKNPETGEDLPYEGQPGYEEAKAQYPDVYAAEEAEKPGDEGPDDAAIPEDGVIPDRDIKPLMDKIDEITDKGEEAAFAEGEAEGEAEEAVEAEAAGDTAPMVEMLGVSEERAVELLDAAKEIPRFAEMTAEDLAKAITEDFQVLMELERVAAMKVTGEGAVEAEVAAPMTPEMV